jgi:hypothetical protein
MKLVLEQYNDYILELVPTLMESTEETINHDLDCVTYAMMDMLPMMESTTAEMELIQESLDKVFSSFFNKTGIKVIQGKGLIQYLIDGGEFVYKAIKLAIKKDSEGIKKLFADTEFKKNFLDFAMKLDGVTLHLITGPLHFIEAVTGIHIGVAFDEIVQDVKDQLKKAYNVIASYLPDLVPEPTETVNVDKYKIGDIKKHADFA